MVQLGFDTREEAQDWQHVLSQYSKDCLSSQSNTSSNVSWNPSSAQKTVGATPQTDTAESMEYNVAYELDSKSEYKYQIQVKVSHCTFQIFLQILP